jgi:uncharacterized lipoprotein YehR (DUF1307 family)
MTRLFCVVFTATLVLSGCIDYEQKTRLDADGSGEMTIHYWAKESLVDWLGKNRFPFNEKDVRTKYGAIPGVTVGTVDVRSNDDDSTRHVTFDLRFTDIRALSKQPGFERATFEWKEEGETMVFTHTVLEDEGSTSEGLEQFGVTYAYTFPGEIVDHNATDVDGATATWKLRLSDLGSTRTLTATVRPAQSWTLTIVFFVVLGAVLLGAVLLIRRRSN